MLEPEQIKIKIKLPPDFITACGAFGIEPQKALQHFLDQISLYAHLTKRCDNPKSVASTIFNSYLERRGYNPEPDYAKREINIQYVKKVIHLIQTKFSRGEKEIFYKNLIVRWYEALQY
jgi:hypothetical protein